MQFPLIIIWKLYSYADGMRKSGNSCCLGWFLFIVWLVFGGSLIVIFWLFFGIYFGTEDANLFFIETYKRSKNKIA
jgi:hypothetical protein